MASYGNYNMHAEIIMFMTLFWIVLNLLFIAWWSGDASSTTKGVVITILTAATLLNLVALYGQLQS